MSRASPDASQAGFTLLEILVALVVLGFLLLGLAQGTRFGLRAWDSEVRLVDRGADMDAMERVVRGLIATADPGELSAPSPFHGQPRTLDMVARLPMAAEAPGARDADIGLGVDATHRLVLRWSPHPHAQRLTKAPPPQEAVLLAGVDHVAFSYLRPPEQGGGWTDTWESSPTLPLLVRVTIVFAKDDRRHWPTIEVAPMLARAQQ